MGFGSKLNSAKAGSTGGGIFFRPAMLTPANKETGEPPVYGTGRYRAKIELMKEFESQKDAKTFFVCETIITESNVAELPAGTRCSYMINVGLAAAPGNVKSLLAAVSKLDPNGSKDAAAIAEQNWDLVYNTAIGKDNPCKGDEFIVECTYRLKKDKKPTNADRALCTSTYTHHVFYPVVEAQAAE